MKIAYFDCPAGISGDMCLGALVDAGVKPAELERELLKLPVKGFRLRSRTVRRAGVSATKVDVIIAAEQKAKARKWRDVEKIIRGSRLDKPVKEKGLFIFKRLFQAEAKIHGERLEEAHLHELGAVDCLVDILGTLAGLALLDVGKTYTSAINLGSGTVKTEHGVLPVPAPATAELLRGYPVFLSDIPFELTTPTGAAIISGLRSRTDPVPCFRTERIGYGAGGKDIPGTPNTLRILIGGACGIGPSGATVAVVETNIDDMNPQFYEEAVEKLFAAGALDVFLENIIMKKGRPAVKLTIITGEHTVDEIAAVLFRETTTIGLRYYRAQRKILDREIRKVKTRYGSVRVKISRLGDSITNIAPEYEDVKALSKKNGLPLKKIASEVQAEVRKQGAAGMHIGY